MSQGLIAYAAAAGIGVLDPTNGKSTIVAPLPAGGAFRVAGPVWGPAPGLNHPVLYFTIHDDRPPERRTTAGVVPYDWLFRVDPFAGTIDPIAASMDSTSEGPIGLVANSHYLGLSVGCCTTYEVDALDLTKPAGPLKVLSKPPAQTAFFTEGAAPGSSGLLAVRAFGTGAWYWLNADAGVVNPFPIRLGADDGPIAFSPDGTMVAVANIDHGAVIEPINSELPLGSPSTSAATVATPSVRPSPTAKGIKHVNSKLPHPDGLSWSPDGTQLAVAVNGEVELYKTSAPDGPPASRHLAGGTVVGVSWSGAITGLTFESVKATKGPQAMVDALLAATKLPAKADTPANRPLTKIYLWQFDSSKTSPLESIADAQPDTLSKYPPMNASVVFHHWAATDTWAMLGGCYRYRVVIAGSVTPAAFTFGLESNTLCSAKPTPTLSPSPSHS
ncbi:MAG TPA: hypothetical protein VEM94_10105 [Candidatus Dormibacteraeota bacterium]|nr:hypothetical protein [Candidatus Dormibacteraeota bacterium]